MNAPCSHNQPVAWQASSRGGSMVAELVIAITISAILLVGIQSSLSMALRSVPDPQSGSTSTLQANRIVDRLSTELETAVYITDHSATSIGFTVPDRDADGVAERVRYQWTGVPGGKLTRQYNGGTVDTIAEQVHLFTLTPSAKTISEAFPALGVEDAAESLMVDYYSTSQTGDNDVTPSNWFGQHFTTTLPAGAIAWRPTRVRFMSKKAALLGSTSVQIRPMTNSLAPSSAILQQFTLTESLLSLGYGWQSFDLTQVAAMPSGASIALVLQQGAGNRSVTVQSTRTFAGMQKSSDGISWNYDNGKSLVSQLYGKLTRFSGEGSISTSYLTSMDIVLRMTATSPTVRTVTGLLNHPETLSGKWKLAFDQNPTTLEINGDGAADWSVVGGTTFDMTTITGGVWRTSGTQLSTNPGCDFAKTTVVDLKLQSLSTGGRGAIFSINALRSGSTCAPILVALAKQTDSTQTLTLQSKLNDSQSKSVITIPGLPNQPLSLHLIVHPADSSVSLTVNDVKYGTFAVNRFNSSDATRAAVVGADGGTAEFSNVCIRVLEN